MKENLFQFLRHYIHLSEKEEALLAQLDFIRAFKKGEIVLKPGEQAQFCYFVLQGCIRSYYELDGEEKTIEFYTEGQPIIPVSYHTKEPSAYFLNCLEDCIVSVGTEETTELVRKEIPQFEELISKFNAQLLTESQVKFETYVTLSPEQRYLHLLKERPGLVQRVPQYLLASYLGMQPETLSRIRKRLAKS